MNSKILTILPTPAERYIAARPALAGASSPQAADGPRLVKSNVETLPSIESVILQKLLAELEGRQITRSQPTYVIEASTPNRVTVHRMLWASSWVLSLAVTALLVNHIDNRAMITGTRDHESRSIEELTANLARQTDAFSSVTTSLQQLAAVIASTAHRTVTVRETWRPPTDPLPQDQAIVGTQAPAASEPVVPIIVGSSAPKMDSSPIPMGGHIHPPIEWAVPPSNCIVHHNSMGLMDYWLMPRTVGGTVVLTKVVPVLQNDSGIFVHHVAEAKDYLVTPSGDWVEVPDTNDKSK